MGKTRVEAMTLAQVCATLHLEPQTVIALAAAFARWSTGQVDLDEEELREIKRYEREERPIERAIAEAEQGVRERNEADAAERRAEAQRRAERDQRKDDAYNASLKEAGTFPRNTGPRPRGQ